MLGLALKFDMIYKLLQVNFCLQYVVYNELSMVIFWAGAFGRPGSLKLFSKGIF
jgi:hypothetical protein